MYTTTGIRQSFATFEEALRAAAARYTDQMFMGGCTMPSVYANGQVVACMITTRKKGTIIEYTDANRKPVTLA